MVMLPFRCSGDKDCSLENEFPEMFKDEFLSKDNLTFDKMKKYLDLKFIQIIMISIGKNSAKFYEFKRGDFQYYGWKSYNGNHSFSVVVY